MGYFFHRFESDSLNWLYALLGDVTPLRSDCGALCGAACCQGDEEDGMILFPGESKYYEDREGFSVQYNTEYRCNCLICHGTCDRDERPLSCRIYPYFFYIGKELRVTAAPDVRAIGRCPLTKEGIRTNKTFLRRMRMAAKVIDGDAELKMFVAFISEKLTDFGGLA